MRAILQRRKVTDAYLRIVGKPKEKWTVTRRTVTRTLGEERRHVKFWRAVYYWILVTLTNKFPSLKGE